MPSGRTADADVKPKRSSLAPSQKEIKASEIGSTGVKVNGYSDPLKKRSKIKSDSDSSRTAAKIDGRAKALGVAGLASLLQSQSPEASSSRKPADTKKRAGKKSSDSKVKGTVKKEEVDDAVEVEQDRGMMMQWATQAIATSKGGISLDEIKEDKAEALQEKATRKTNSSMNQMPKPSGTKPDIRLGKASVLHPVPGDDALTVVDLPSDKNTALRRELRDMVTGATRYDRESQKVPGNYLAIDCEMVGLGHNGMESCLARVSIVNYHGYIVLDTFVRPKERVTDWRTWVSGVRPKDMNDARHFEDVQAEVAKLIDGKIVIGHAVENDTKALLLSHPSPLLRDTQRNAALRQIAKTKMPGLKKLTELELGLKIQSGSHSSVTDARATMALYRLHKTEWEQAMWKETQAFLAKQKKGHAADAPLAKKSHERDMALGGQKRKATAEDGAASKRPKKTASNVNGAGGGLGQDDGNWWEV